MGTAGATNEGFVDNKVNAMVGLFPALLYLIIVKSDENLDNNYCCKTTILVFLVPHYGIFYYTTLFTLYKSPEKKWHRSVKMDKNINVHFSKVPGKCCNRPLRKTRYEHNAANSDFSLKTLAAHFFSVLCGKGFRKKYSSILYAIRNVAKSRYYV